MLCRFRRLRGILPENGCAALRRNDRVHGIFEHDGGIADAERQCAAAAAFSDDHRDDRRFQPHHFKEVFGDGLALSAFLRVNAAVRAGAADQADDRAVKFLGLLHQAEGLAVSLGLRAAEMPPHPFLDRVAAFHGDDRDGNMVDIADAADDCRIVRVTAVAVQLDEIVDHVLNVVRSHRALAAARSLYALIGGLVLCLSHVGSGLPSVMLPPHFCGAGRAALPVYTGCAGAPRSCR